MAPLLVQLPAACAAVALMTPDRGSVTDIRSIGGQGRSCQDLPRYRPLEAACSLGASDRDPAPGRGTSAQPRRRVSARRIAEDTSRVCDGRYWAISPSSTSQRKNCWRRPVAVGGAGRSQPGELVVDERLDVLTPDAGDRPRHPPGRRGKRRTSRPPRRTRGSCSATGWPPGGGKRRPRGPGRHRATMRYPHGRR